jgi:hypothetical protein
MLTLPESDPYLSFPTGSTYKVVTVTKKSQFYKLDTYGQFNKHFMDETYGTSKITCTIVHCMHAPIKCFQNVLA